MSKPIVISPGVQGFVAAGGARVAIRQEAPPPPVDPTPMLIERARREAEAATEARLRREFAQEQQREAQKWAKFESQLDRFFQDVEKQVADQLIRMAIKVGEALLRREFPDPAMIECVIRETLTPISDVQGARVRLHPADAERYIKARSLSGTPSVCDRVEVVPDSGLKPGDIMMESRNGYFDASIDQRLALLDARLRERYRSAHADHPRS